MIRNDVLIKSLTLLKCTTLEVNEAEDYRTQKAITKKTDS